MPATPESKVVTLKYEPRKWQRECHQLLRRFSVLAVHRQAGKSELAEMVALSRAPKCKLELPRYAFLSPTLKQSRSNMWDRMKFKTMPLLEAKGLEVREDDMSLRFLNNGAKLQLYGANDPDSLRGGYLDGIVVDEVAQVDPMVWKEIVRPMLASRNGWALFIGTPNGINLFSELFFYAEKGTDPDWVAKKYTCYETDALSASEIEQIKQQGGPNAFAREMLCDFNAQSDDQVIPLSLAVEASRRIIPAFDTVVRASPVVIGVDPARFGDDRSVIARRQGLCLYPPIVLRGVDNMELAARVASEIRQHNPRGVFVDAGAGSGVIDRLRQLGHSIVEVPFGGRAIKSDDYANRRTEMWFNMRDWLDRGGALPPDCPELVRELATPTWWFNNRDQRIMESKESIKQRLPMHGSPDIADAFGLTLAVHVASQFDYESLDLRSVWSRPKDYNPYAAGWRDR